VSEIEIIEAPLSGTLESIEVSVGDHINAGDLLLVMESMKVHVQVKAERSGTIVEISASLGTTVKREQSLVRIALSQNSANNVEPMASETAAEHLATLDEFIARRDLSLDSNRQSAAQKRHAKGYLTARENLALLCDANSFQEYGQLAVAAQRGRIDYQTLKTTTAADGIITGVGQVNAEKFKQSETVLVINDYSVLAGTQGFYHHQKLDRMLETAKKRQLPVIMYSEGGGGRPGDTDVTVVNSGLQCASFGTWAGLAGQVPRIAVANGYNFAGNAALFGAADITIATKRSWIGMAGPAMIEGGGLGQFKPTDIGPIEVQSENGVVDIVADDEAHAAELAKQVLGYFQGEISAWIEPDAQRLRVLLPENRRLTYAIRSIIQHLCDVDSFVELKSGYGGSIVTGFMRIEGKAIGVLANDCSVLGGAIDVAAGEKAAEFIELCESFAIPLISLCDTPGFMVGPDHEQQGAVRRLAKLFTAGSKITVPLIGVVIRKCYGLGAQAMLGGSTLHPLYTLAWPSGEFGPMGLEGAVKLGFKKELSAVADASEQQALFDKLLAKQYEKGQAIEVAASLEIDAVIDPADTRAAIASVLR
jgi:acetyl-CoA carboxylase carboxyltransferase component